MALQFASIRRLLVHLIFYAAPLILFFSTPGRKLLQPDQEYTTPVYFETLIQPIPPPTLFDGTAYHFGRWKLPIAEPRLHSLTFYQSFVQKKEWHFTAISDGDKLFGIAVGQLNYVASGFVYVLDGKTGTFSYHSQLFPLGFGATISPSSIRGCSNWTSSPFRISMCGHARGWDVDVSAKLNHDENMQISSTITTEDSESLVLSYPIGPRRVAYTHKESGMTATGTVKIDNTLHQLTNGVALIDWTRSMHRRLTLWFWVALTFVTSDGNRIGINLSNGVYPDMNGIGLENAVWLDDTVYIVNSRLQVDGEPGKGIVKIGHPWHCNTEDGSIDLTIVPIGAVPSEVNAGPFAKGNLFHSFGLYNGWVTLNETKYNIVDVPGILEDHYALW